MRLKNGIDCYKFPLTDYWLNLVWLDGEKYILRSALK